MHRRSAKCVGRPSPDHDEIQHRWFSEAEIAEMVANFLARRQAEIILTPAEHDTGAAYGPSFPPRFVDRNSIWQPAQVPEARDHHAFVDHGN